MTARRIPIPRTFLVVVAAVIFLIIFFGAWAVSADGDGRGRALSFGYAGTSGLDSRTPNNSQVSADGQGEAASDSWWGGAFLKACPFH